MYLFTRSRRMRANDPGGAIAWTIGITEQVRSITGHEVNAWGSVLSPDAGLIVWSMWAEHLSDLEQASDKLMASSEFLDAVKAGEAFGEAPQVDGLAMLVHGEPDLAAGPPAYVAVASAVAAPGHLGEAIAAGIEIADHATRVSGQSTMFAVNSTGPYGGCAWFTGSPDIDTVEAGEAALMGDPDWVKLIDRVGTAYNSDAAQALYRRIA
jgi:hypothetical protein